MTKQKEMLITIITNEPVTTDAERTVYDVLNDVGV